MVGERDKRVTGPRRSLRASPATALDGHKCGARKAAGGVEGDGPRRPRVPAEGARVLAWLFHRLGKVGWPSACVASPPRAVAMKTRLGRRQLHGLKKAAAGDGHGSRVDLAGPTVGEPLRRTETRA